MLRGQDQGTQKMPIVAPGRNWRILGSGIILLINAYGHGRPGGNEGCWEWLSFYSQAFCCGTKISVESCSFVNWKGSWKLLHSYRRSSPVVSYYKNRIFRVECQVSKFRSLLVSNCKIKSNYTKVNITDSNRVRTLFQKQIFRSFPASEFFPGPTKLK